jgi:hypothetical protein
MKTNSTDYPPAVMNMSGRVSTEYTAQNRKILLERMDKAFGEYCHQAEKLSVMLAEPRDPHSWTLYHDLQKQRTAEIVAFEQYRKIKEELFSLMTPPKAEDRRESSVG